jgi:hypothetical protein
MVFSIRKREKERNVFRIRAISLLIHCLYWYKRMLIYTQLRSVNLYVARHICAYQSTILTDTGITVIHILITVTICPILIGTR